MLAGRNPVCTDAIATAVMGYDPMAEAGDRAVPRRQPPGPGRRAGPGHPRPEADRGRGAAAGGGPAPVRLGAARAEHLRPAPGGYLDSGRRRRAAIRAVGSLFLPRLHTDRVAGFDSCLRLDFARPSSRPLARTRSRWHHQGAGWHDRTKGPEHGGRDPTDQALARRRLAGDGPRGPQRRLLPDGQARHAPARRVRGRGALRRRARRGQGRPDPPRPPAAQPVLRLERPARPARPRRLHRRGPAAPGQVHLLPQAHRVRPRARRRAGLHLRGDGHPDAPRLRHRASSAPPPTRRRSPS